MPDTTTPTWRNAQRDAEAAAAERFAEAIANSDDVEDSGADYAHEYADACEDVIYTYRARAIWADAADVQAYEDDAKEYASSADGFSIDRAITACVYLAIRDAFGWKWGELLGEQSEGAAA
jgi:hypothetical protein